MVNKFALDHRTPNGISLEKKILHPTKLIIDGTYVSISLSNMCNYKNTLVKGG